MFEQDRDEIYAGFLKKYVDKSETFEFEIIQNEFARRDTVCTWNNMCEYHSILFV